MAKRSILSSVREEQPTTEDIITTPPEQTARAVSAVKPSRRNKLHIGGYYDPEETAIIAFQKLGIDLRKTQQEMLLEAVRDFVAKHEAASAFR